MKGWGKRSAPQAGQVWEHTVGHEMFLIIEDLRYGYNEWRFDVFDLMTGVRREYHVAGQKAQNFLRRVA